MVLTRTLAVKIFTSILQVLITLKEIKGSRIEPGFRVIKMNFADIFTFEV